MQSLKLTKENILSLNSFLNFFNDIEAPMKRVLPFLPRKLRFSIFIFKCFKSLNLIKQIFFSKNIILLSQIKEHS